MTQLVEAIEVADSTIHGQSACSVEVVIVSYNSRDSLAAALTSIYQHLPAPASGISATVAVWDNASIEQNVELVTEQFPQVRLIAHSDNIGFGQAMNALVASSTADYVLMINPDVQLDADVISPLLAELRADPVAVLAAPRLRGEDGQLQLSARLLPTLATELASMLAGTKASALAERAHLMSRLRGLSDPSRQQQTIAADFVWATCWLISRPDAVELGPFDDRFPLYDEDLDCCVRAARAGRRLLYVPAVEVMHIGGASSTPERKRQLMYTARARYYRTHRGRWASWCFRAGYQGAWWLKRGHARLAGSPGRSTGRR